MVSLPKEGYVRLRQIIGDRKSGVPGFIPICRTAWMNGVKAGRFPQPVKLGPRTIAWKVEDIRAIKPADQMDLFGSEGSNQ